MTKLEFLMSLSTTQKAILNNLGRVSILTEQEQEFMQQDLIRRLNEFTS